jgi:hypothetical protein
MGADNHLTVSVNDDGDTDEQDDDSEEVTSNYGTL